MKIIRVTSAAAFATKYGITIGHMDKKAVFDAAHGTPVFVNTRLRTSFGMARFRGKRPYRIDIHPKILEHPEVLKETLLHEIAHVIAGIDEGHGPLWQLIALKIGSNGRRLASAEQAAALGITRKRRRKRARYSSKDIVFIRQEMKSR